MQKSTKTILSVFIILLAFISLAGCNGTNPGNKAQPSPSPTKDDGFKDFSIIYTSNLQGNALPLMMEQVSTKQPTHHFSQTLEIIDRLKAGNEGVPVLLLDSGNSLVGADDFTRMFNGKPMMDLMKMAGYDAVLLGFDPGIDFNKIKADKPFMIMNDDPKDFSLTTKDIAGHKINIFALKRGMYINYPNVEKMKPMNSIILELNEFIKENKADYNILLCNVFDIDFLTKNLKGIDLIIPGNYHDILKAKEVTLVNGTPVAPFVDSRFDIGKLDIKNEKKIDCRVVPTGGAEQMPSGKVMQVLEPYLEEFNKKYPENYKTVMSTFVGYGTDNMTHSLKSPDESPAANFVTDVMRNATGADIAIINNLAIRKDLRGIISVQRLRDVLYFDNELVTMDLTGEEIEKILSSNAKKGGTIYRFSGVILGINPDKEKVMILDVSHSEDKGLIDKKKTYRVVTIDYLVNSDKMKYESFKNGKNKKFTGLYLNNLILDRLSDDSLISSINRINRTVVDDKLDKDVLSNHYKRNLFKVMQVSTNEGLYKLKSGNLEELSKRLLESEFPVDEIFAAICLFRAGKIQKSKTLFKKLAKKYPESFPLRKIAASFPDENAVAGAAPTGTVRWATFKGDFRRTGRSQYAGGKDGKILWKFRTYHTIQSSPVIGHGGVIYCAAGDGFLYALKPEGAEKWKVKLGKVLLASPTVSKLGVIYVGNDKGIMFAVSHTGKILWKFNAGGWIKSTAAIADNGTVYFGSDSKHLFALNPDGQLKWKVKLGDDVFSSPAIDSDGNIYMGCVDRNFYCITPDGKIKWKFATKGKIYSTPAISDDDTITFGSDDGFVYALTPDGSLKWKLKTGGFVPSSPAVAKDGTVFIGSEDNNLYAIAPDGKVRWKFKTDYEIFGSPVIDREGNVYFGSDDTQFYALTTGGKLMWKIRTGKYIESSPCIAPDGTIYFGSEDGFVYAVK